MREDKQGIDRQSKILNDSKKLILHKIKCTINMDTPKIAMSLLPNFDLRHHELLPLQWGRIHLQPASVKVRLFGNEIMKKFN